MKVLVTGAGGFVGRYVLDNMRSHGHEVIAASHSAEDLPEDQAEIFDIGNADAVREVFERHRPSAVIHLAAQASVPQSWTNPAETYRVNVIGTSHVLEAARHWSEDGVLLVGSAQQYGLGKEQPLKETDPMDPLSPYAVSKTAQELVGGIYYRRFGLRILLTRPFNHTGPGQSKEYAVGSFCSQIVESERGERERIEVGGLGAVRDFLDVRDVADAYRLLLGQARAGEVYNICSGRGVLMSDILKMLLEASPEAARLEVVTDSERHADATTLIGDNSKLKADVGWEARVPLEKSLQETLDWYRQSRSGPA